MAITFVKRPTSPLHFEPIETPPEGVLYPGSDQEEEYDERKRVKKKLRVELLAKQYLEGRGLLIQSAALRGPFDKGWINPWASKKRKRGVHSIQWSSRVPATEEGRLKYTELEKGSFTVKRRPVRDVEPAQPNNHLEKRASTARRSTEQEEHTAKRKRHEPLEEPNGHHDAQRPVDADSPAYATQQEYWLKTNKHYLQRGARKDRKSPTPTPIARNGAQEPVSPPPHTKPQLQTMPVPVTPTTQRKYVEPAGFTSINKPLVSKDRENPPATTSRTRTNPQQDKVAIDKSDYIRVKERDLDTADEMTRRGCEEVEWLSREAAKQTELKDEVRWVKMSSRKAFQPCYLGTLGKSGPVEPYVSVPSFTDDAKNTTSLRASSKPPNSSPHAVPPSTYVPEFQYGYAGKVYTYGSSRKGSSFVEAPEEGQPRPRASSSSSGSDSFAKALGATQVKAGSKQMASSHSLSPVVEDYETTSAKKNTSAIRRLTFTPSGGARVAQRRASSRPSSSFQSAGPGASPTKEKEGKENAPKENAFLRTASTKSSDLPISNGIHSRNSDIFPEAQIAENAHVQFSQKPSGPSTNLLETDKPSPKFPSLDEGDSYANLSTQAAFLKAQRSFKDDILSSLKDSPTKKIEKCQAASRSEGPDVTPPANSGRPNGSVAQWNNFNSQDSDDEGPMSTQAMVDAMSPFAITAVKKYPPSPWERTNFAPSPTRQKPPVPAPVIPPGSSTTAAFHQNSPLRSFDEEFANTLPRKVLSGFHETRKRVPTEPASKNTTKGRPRQPACNSCRKNKRRCIHDIFGNELPHKVTEQAIPRRPNARRDFRDRKNDASQPSQEDQNQEESSRPAPEDNNLQDSSHSAPRYHNLESPATTPFRNKSFSMSTSPSQNPPKTSPPIPLSHPNTTSKLTSSLTSSFIHPDGKLTETSVFQDGQQPQQDWDISLPLDPFGPTSEEHARSGSVNGDEEAEIKSNEPAEGGNAHEDKEPESLDLNATIDEATSFLGKWDVEAEARKEGTLSRNRETGLKGILSIDRWSG